MAIAGALFEIVDGVRRARAFELFGLTTIQAVVQNPDGTHGPEFAVEINDLRSPHKAAIDLSDNVKQDRFFRIVIAVRQGKASMIPPIVVQSGSRGARIRDLGWIT